MTFYILFLWISSRHFIYYLLVFAWYYKRTTTGKEACQVDHRGNYPVLGPENKQTDLTNFFCGYKYYYLQIHLCLANKMPPAIHGCAHIASSAVHLCILASGSFAIYVSINFKLLLLRRD